MTDNHSTLAGLSGGKKQRWINAHLDMIALVHDALGSEETCRTFYLKPETLESALQRQEKRHRPAITRADKAMLKAQDADNKGNMALKELNLHFDMITQLKSEADEQKENLTSYFKLMEQANGLMARLCQSTHNNSSERYITYIVRTK
ncbi:hypothetical protein ACFLUW_00415 [Chloroflexota bacterium]